jgi:hypothetical protein
MSTCYYCSGEVWIACEVCERFLCHEHHNACNHDEHDELPSVGDVRKMNQDNVIKFLQRQDLNLYLDNKDIKIIKSKKISGRALLNLTDEKLESYGLHPGPAGAIADLVKEIKGEYGELHSRLFFLSFSVIFTNNTKYLVLMFSQLIPERLTERELFRINLPLPVLWSITTNTTTESTTRQLPDIPVLHWETFLDEAFTASSSINNTVRKFNNPAIDQEPLTSEGSTVDLFLEIMNELNNKRLKELPEPEKWGKRERCYNTLGNPDIIRFRASDNDSMKSINDTDLLSVVEVKPEQLLMDLIEGVETTDDKKLRIGMKQEVLSEAYNLAARMEDDGTTDYTKHEMIMRIIQQIFGYMVVNDLKYGMITSYVRTWFLKRGSRNLNQLYISPAVPINQKHSKNQASFLECMHYFEDISRVDPFIPPTTDDDDDDAPDDDDDNAPDDYDDDAPDYYDDDAPPTTDDDDDDAPDDDDDEYMPTESSTEESSTEPKYQGPIKRRVSPRNTQKSAQTGSKTIAQDARKNIKKFKNTNDDKLLVDMKNYDREQFYFRKTLGFGRSGKVITAKLCGKLGALKMADLYKNNVQLKEMLNEIKIYLIPLKKIQGIHIPKILDFGVLHEAFVFILMSIAGESFASMKNKITEEEKQLAISGLLAIHAKGVKHGDIRLENIMLKRNELIGSCVWWIDFAWSKMTDNAIDLDKELTELKRLLGVTDKPY